MNKRVAVLMGGISAERNVSLSSGKQCASALREIGDEVDEIDVTDNIGALVRTLEDKPDVAFNALHGRYGEDGCIQGLLNLLKIPYTHSGVLASALAMNKFAARNVFAAQNIGMAEAVIISPDQIKSAEVMPPPYVIKPINEGSSIGVSIIHDSFETLPDLKSQPNKLLVERYIPGRELTVAVMGGA